MKVIFNSKTGLITAWCLDENGKMRGPRDGESMVDLGKITPPSVKSDIYFLNPTKTAIVPNPSYIEPENMSEAWKKATTTEEKLGILALKVGLS